MAVVIDGANRHDVKLLEETLDRLVLQPPNTKEQPHLCADAGYTGKKARQQVIDRGYIPHIRSRGDEQQEKQEGKHPRRWVVEVLFSWLNRFRKLLVRFEKKSQNYLGLLHFACALIVWRKMIAVHT
jgi:putative transposase